MSVRQAAEHSGVSEKTVRGWVADGSLPHYRLGANGRRGKIAIALEDLEAFLKARKVPARTALPAPKRAKPVSLKHLRLPS
jgi:excisionase family DNA binding protein